MVYHSCRPSSPLRLAHVALNDGCNALQCEIEHDIDDGDLAQQVVFQRLNLLLGKAEALDLVHIRNGFHPPVERIDTLECVHLLQAGNSPNSCCRVNIVSSCASS